MNWPDLRDGASDKVATKPSRFQTTWCYGAPGIGPARLGALCPWRNAALRFAIDAALETTRRQGFGANHSLCHGDLGYLDLFHEASVRLDEPKWGAVARQLASQILHDGIQQGWRCGTVLGTQTRGMMTG